MKKLLVTAFLFHVLFSNGQVINYSNDQRVLDFINREIRTKTGTDRVDALNELSRYIAIFNPDSSLRLSKQALALSRAMGYEEGKGGAFLNIGIYHYYQQQHMKALEKYFEALPLLEKTEPSRKMGILMLHFGMLNTYTMNYNRAKYCYDRALSNFRAIGDSLAMMDVLWYKWGVFIGGPEVNFELKGPLENDSGYILNEIQLNYYLRHPWNSNFCYNIMVALNRKALFYLGKRDPRAIGFFKKSLGISKRWGIEYGIAAIPGGISQCYDTIFKDTARAMEYARLQYCEQGNSIDRSIGFANSCAVIGDLYMRQNKYSNALEYLNRGRNYLDSILKKKDDIKGNLEGKYFILKICREWRIVFDSMLCEVYHRTGNLPMELATLKTYYREKDSLLLDQTNVNIRMMQSTMDVENAKNEAVQLAKEAKLRNARLTQLRILFAGIALILVITGLLIVSWFRRKRLRSEQNTLLMEQKLLRSQMNPHFIFNSLASIQNYIISEKPVLASDYLGRFSKLIRNILDNSVEELVPLEKEIETIKNYLELQKIRYADKFDYNIRIDRSLETENTCIPPMLAQPFIENSIEHGIKHLVTRGHIDIRFTLENGMIRFEVEDNGIGREKAREVAALYKDRHRPMATSITSERLKVLNRKLRTKIVLEITDLKNSIGEAIGTKVSFGIPIAGK
jgi:hypothetical protein